MRIIVLIWTSTSAVPFDFVVSDNFCFFGNETDMRKYDGTMVTKWGCDPPPNAPPVVLEAGTLPPGMAVAGNVLSGTPTTAGTSQITFTVTDSVGATTSQTFNFTVNPQVLTIATIPNLVAMTQGVAASQTFTAKFRYSCLYVDTILWDDSTGNDFIVFRYSVRDTNCFWILSFCSQG